MSDGFKFPIPGGTPDPYGSEGGGDLKWMQLATLGEYAFAMAVFPIFQKMFLYYGVTVPSDPQFLHKAADGWSAIGGNVHAAGRSAQEHHDNVSPANWQGLDRQAYGQKVTQFAMGSQDATDSANRLSWILRVLANVWTAWIYYNFANATYMSMIALAGMVSGPGKIYAGWQARSRAFSVERRILQLRNFVLTSMLQVLMGYGVAWVADHTLTDGLK
ncbi:hypothetical protein [Streptosporangium sp. NBC_01756]|uniref:hypothetical protein n=1 Tax=Streptosporangium sp. NBC_01756 TaxID=2975950 RepID=UPI002DDB3770|nr:hypothetical protein [Streptosporangium sp. NBC_01756]WSC88936.1 hypothetical protein OIE48_12335 [Streptosporangium sp. NBC_01756]